MDRNRESQRAEKLKIKRLLWRLVSVMVHTRIAEGQEGVGRDAGAAHKGAAWSGPTIASPLRALQCPTTASLPERIGPASKRESSSASDLGCQMPSLCLELAYPFFLSFVINHQSLVEKKKRKKKNASRLIRRYDARNYVDDIDFPTNPHLEI